MTASVITFLGPSRRADTATLVHHTAWMLTELGHRVLVVDLDPQADVSTVFLDDHMLASLWASDNPQVARTRITEALTLIPAEPRLNLDERSMASIPDIATEYGAEFVLVAPGPGVSSLHRLVLAITTAIVLSFGSDPLSAYGLPPLLRNLHLDSPDRPRFVGYTIRSPESPDGSADAAFVQGFISGVVNARVLQNSADKNSHTSPAKDPACLAVLKPFTSLSAMAREARRPIFSLRTADGAIGAHARAVQIAHRDYTKFVERLLAAIRASND